MKLIAILKQPQKITAKLNKTIIHEYPPLQEKNIMPIAEVQEIVPDEGIYGFSKVRVEAVDLQKLTNDATATEKDILEGKIAYVDGKRLEGIMSDTGIAEKIYEDGVVIALKYKEAKYALQRYEELKYLECNAKGRQYINTGYRHKANTRVEIKFRQSSSNTNDYIIMFGARKTNYLYNAFLFFTKYQGSKFAYCRTNNETANTALYDKDVTLIADKLDTTYSDGTNTYTIHATGYSDAGVNDFFLFGANTADAGGLQVTGPADGSATGLRIYYCKLYEGDTLVRDFIPVKDTVLNKIGMLDRVTNILYTNAGTGEFTYEKVV